MLTVDDARALAHRFVAEVRAARLTGAPPTRLVALGHTYREALRPCPPEVRAAFLDELGTEPDLALMVHCTVLLVLAGGFPEEPART